MAGIYLHFRPSGLDQHDRDTFDSRFANRVTRLPSDRIEQHTEANLRAAARLFDAFARAAETVRAPMEAALQELASFVPVREGPEARSA